MILADTSVWVDHLRKSNVLMSKLLNSGQILVHPFVIGELALGDLRQRRFVLSGLDRLSKRQIATEKEVLRFIEAQGLHGRGIGYVDAHLLAAVRLTPGTWLWTLDKRLEVLASALNLAMRPPDN